MTIKYRAICYDVGTDFSPVKSTRPAFDLALAGREIDVLRNQLHCNAVRIAGTDIDRLVHAATFALAQDMFVWFSPALIDATPQATCDYLVECARRAESLRGGHDRIVFVVGGEYSFFMQGIIAGRDYRDRIKRFIRPSSLVRHLVTGGRWPGRRLSAFLKSTAAAVREHFHGPLTYAAGTWERIDWRHFDLVGINYYRDAQNEKNYARGLSRYMEIGKPVLITEFGCCTYAGADAKGAIGWDIIDASVSPPLIKGDYTRSEETQSRYLGELLACFASRPIAGVCIYNFAGYNLPHHADPRRDLDLASYGIVKVLSATGDSAARRDFPWEPKQAFHVVAECYREMEQA
jgi:hypothetical protein